MFAEAYRLKDLQDIADFLRPVSAHMCLFRNPFNELLSVYVVVSMLYIQLDYVKTTISTFCENTLYNACRNVQIALNDPMTVSPLLRVDKVKPIFREF